MPWVRFDDMYPIHRKVAPLDDATFRLHAEALFWCSRNKTDGRIATDELSTISTRATKQRVGKLIERNLWHVASQQCTSEQCPPPGPDGWVVHDYLEYQPTKEKIEADLAVKAERTRKWRERQAANRKPPGASSDASRDGPRKASRHASRDASSEGARDAAPSPPPPRREAGDGTSPEAPAAASGVGSPPAGENHKPRLRLCRTCGNALTSAYHRNACRDGAQ